MNFTRRTFLRSTLLTAAALAVPRWAFAAFDAPVRHLTLENLHTGESAVQVPFWQAGHYVPDALENLNYVLRDHRTGDVAPIETAVLDQLFALQQLFGERRPVQIISGYRSPHSNALLHAKSSGVAKNSLHMQAKAIDMRISGIALTDLRAAALALGAGGVGFYPRSNFVHVDSGRVRQWMGS